MFEKIIKMMKNFESSREQESGNVLFLILIAVALFAALSYAVTQSSRTGGGASDGEQNLINSAQITQYPASVRTAIVRMIINGTDESQFNFDPPADFGTTCNAAPTACVFHPSGGGATSVTAPPDIMTSGAQGVWIFTSDYAIDSIGTTGAVNSANDIIAFLPGISQSICQRLNVELGIPTAADPDGDGVAPAVSTTVPVLATHNMDNTNTGIGSEAQGASLELGGVFAGQPFGCVDFDNTGDSATDADLAYYHVLVER